MAKNIGQSKIYWEETAIIPNVINRKSIIRTNTIQKAAAYKINM